MQQNNSAVRMTHCDAFTEQIQAPSAKKHSQVDLTHKWNPDADGGGAASHGSNIEIEHPVTDVAELQRRAHLAVQIGRANRTSAASASREGQQRTHEIAKTFDATVLDVADVALSVEETSFADLPLKPRHVKAVMLLDAWGANSRREIVEHLDEHETIVNRIGYDTAPSNSTVARAAKSLEAVGHRDTIRAAATRSVHAVTRAGIQLPDGVAAAHGLDVPPIIDESLVTSETRRAAIRNWVGEVLDEVLAPITFDRAENTQFSVREIIAALAQAALVSGGVRAGPVTAAWYYNESDIPTAGHVSRLLAELDRNEIGRMFTLATERFLDIVGELGFFDDERDIACDPTWVTWWGEDNVDDPDSKLLRNPEECESGYGWCFSTVSLTDSDARFAVGIDIAGNKTERSPQFRRLMRPIKERDSVGRVHIDREFFSAPAVRACRAIADDNWVIRAKKLSKGAVADVIDATPVDEPRFKPNVEFSGLSVSPNLYVHPVPDALQDRYQMSPQLAFLTDLSPAECDMADLFETYQYRWSAETFIRQLKHEYTPNTQSPNHNTRLFLFHLGTLLYNLHTLINRAASPQYALRLDVTYYEVLLGVVDSTFTRTGDTP